MSLFELVVEYAMEAISHAGTVLAVLTKEGIVLAAEKKVTGKLLDLSSAKDGGYGGSGEKIFLLNSYVSTPSSHISLSQYYMLWVMQECCCRCSRYYSRCELAR